MADITLDLTPLINAISRLREGIARYDMDTTDTQIRDGLIQRMPFQDLIRLGNEQGLILSDWPRWRQYRDMRSKTSHTYNEGVALEVVAQIPGFLAEAAYLRDQIVARLG